MNMNTFNTTGNSRKYLLDDVKKKLNCFYTTTIHTDAFSDKKYLL